MNPFKKPKALVQTTCSAVIATMVMAGPASTFCSAEPDSGASPAQTNSAPSQANLASSQTNAAPSPAKSVDSKASPPDARKAAEKAAVKRQITGAELYSINCNRCHQERFPTERTGAQWKTIMLHMQVRANIPASQARLILQYLQENSGR
jgi:mono/diheme cytochrome c family protein